MEEWSTRREHIEDEFRWDGRTLLNLGLFVGLVPYLVYVGGWVGGRVRRGRFGGHTVVEQSPG